MSQSTSLSKPEPEPEPELKFLLDENVKKRLERFLASKGYDVISPKGVSNGNLAELSKSEKRVLVTNDSDFADAWLFPREKVFSVVWLTVPQDKPEALLKAFALLLERRKGFEGFLITLKEDDFKASPIPSLKAFKSEHGRIETLDPEK